MRGATAMDEDGPLEVNEVDAPVCLECGSIAVPRSGVLHCLNCKATRPDDWSRRIDCPSFTVRVLTDQEAYNLRRYGRFHAAPSDPGEFWVNGVLTNGGNR